MNQIMKTTRLIFALAAIVAALTIVSCEKPEPETQDKPNTETPEEKPEETPELPVAANANTYVINGTEKVFGSAAMMMVGEDPAIAATPAEGYTSVMDIMIAEDLEYFFGAVNPALMDKDIDMMTETEVFTIYSTLADGIIEMLAPGEVGEITQGTCKMTCSDEGVFTFTAGMILTDGTTLAVNIQAKAEEEVEVNENEIGIGETIKPIRAAFYMEDEDMTCLYFTPSEIYYFYEEIDMATYYMYLIMDNSLLTGEDIELDELGDKTFMFGMVDNATGDMISFDNTSLDGIEGAFNVIKTDVGCYAATFEFIIDGEMYYVSYEGECTSVDEEAPEEENVFACGDEFLVIESAELEKGEELWTLWMNLENEKTVSIVMPAEYFTDEEEHGFSFDQRISVTYDGRTYSKDNGDSGTVAVLVDEEAGIVDAWFTNYDDCELYYIGEFSAK